MNPSSIREGKGAYASRSKLRQEVARSSDAYSTASESLAMRFAKAVEPSQVRGLENLAYGTDKISDILDFIKTQIGRERWPVAIGQDLLEALRNLQQEAKRIAQGINSEDPNLPRQTHLLLCREYVKHLTAQFLYKRRLSENEEKARG